MWANARKNEPPSASNALHLTKHLTFLMYGVWSLIYFRSLSARTKVWVRKEYVTGALYSVYTPLCVAPFVCIPIELAHVPIVRTFGTPPRCTAASLSFTFSFRSVSMFYEALEPSELSVSSFTLCLQNVPSLMTQMSAP